jgi:hypothetical protein
LQKLECIIKENEVRMFLSMNDNIILQKLLNKIAVKRFNDIFNEELKDRRITNIELSIKAGKLENAFNKTINEAEDPRMSTFLRYWNAVIELINEKDNESPIDFNQLLDEKVRKILSMAGEMQEADVFHSIRKNKDFYIGLKVYVDILNKKGVLTIKEVKLYSKIMTVIEKLEEQS